MTDHPKSVWIHEAVHRRLKIAAAARGQTITELVDEAVQAWLRLHENGAAAPKNGSAGDGQSHP